MSLMSERDELLELLKPVIAMREAWFGYFEDKATISGVEEGAEKIDLLLGATLAAYKFFIDERLPESSSSYQWQKSPDDGWQPKNRKYSFDVDFYAGMHFWKLSELIVKLTYESSRTHFFIRSSLLREILYKQLELCRLMMNFSSEGDIWDRAFSAARALIELLYKDENPAQGLTQAAQYECLHDSEQLEFSYPRFRHSKEEHEHLLHLFGLGIDIYLRSLRMIPESVEDGNIRAIIDEETERIVSLSYDTNEGTFFRELGYWWEFLDDASEYFDKYELCQVTPDFIRYFDENSKDGITTADMLPYVQSA